MRNYSWHLVITAFLIMFVIERSVRWNSYRHLPELNQEFVTEEVSFFEVPDSLVAPNREYFRLSYHIDTIRAGFFPFLKKSSAVLNIGLVPLPKGISSKEREKAFSAVLQSEPMKTKVANMLANK